MWHRIPWKTNCIIIALHVLLKYEIKIKTKNKSSTYAPSIPGWLMLGELGGVWFSFVFSICILWGGELDNDPWGTGGAGSSRSTDDDVPPSTSIGPIRTSCMPYRQKEPDWWTFPTRCQLLLVSVYGQCLALVCNITHLYISHACHDLYSGFSITKVEDIIAKTTQTVMEKMSNIAMYWQCNGRYYWWYCGTNTVMEDITDGTVVPTL